MLHCPFCHADLEAASARLRGGRCPDCGGIVNWTEPATSPNEVPPPSVAIEPRGLPEDEDRLPMQDIVRTLVKRGFDNANAGPGGAPTIEMTPPAGCSDKDLSNLWGDSLTVHSRPSMTLKASSHTPEAAISQLLIRSHHIRELGDPEPGGAEYELEEAIGEGGVGIVYAARQASIDRTVALKMLKTEFAHKTDHRNKFLSEAVVTGELDHPNIVPIYDVGTSDLGSLFYAMKRVRGTPWSAVIGERSLADNLRILMSVADAIAFAHARGVIHRDLKPENVMLGDFGEVLVMDWGIALSTAMFVKAGRISQTTSMGGTPAYMAPEMATGPLDAIGPASDVYLLGAILYEIVSGKPPHTGKDVLSCLYAAARNEIQPTDKTGELLDIAM
jgi:serine/threonine protein kinase